MSSFNLLVVVIASRKFHRNPFSILAKRKKYRWHGTDTGTERQRNRTHKAHNAFAAAEAAEAEKVASLSEPHCTLI